YTPGVASIPGTDFPNLGMVQASSKTAPEKVTALVAAFTELFESFAQDGPTAAEMDTAKKQGDNPPDQQMREPGFWIQMLGTLDYHGRTLESIMAAPAA